MISTNTKQLTITLFENNKMKTVTCKDQEQFKELYTLFTTNPNSVTEVLEGTYRKEVGEGLYEDIDGNTYVEGIDTPILPGIKDYLLENLELGIDITNIINFLKLLALNPDKQVKDNLFNFIKQCGFIITQEGYFLGYKAVRLKKGFEQYFTGEIPDINNPDSVVADLREFQRSKEYCKKVLLENVPVFTDIHSGTVDIQLGVPVTMDREDCDSNPNTACSSGLHNGTLGYANWFKHSGDIIILTYVNPANVVAVPYDYNSQKIRTCEYLPVAVIEEVNGVVTLHYTEHSKNLDMTQIMEVQSYKRQLELDPGYTGFSNRLIQLGIE